MPAFHPRRRNDPRPSYLPTAVEERLNKPVLPSDKLGDWEKRQLVGRGIDLDYLDSLAPDVVRVKIALPDTPVPETHIRVYKPTEEQRER